MNNQVELIKTEIKRRIEINKYADTPGYLKEDEALLQFINSLPEEPASDFDKHIQQGDEIVVGEDGQRVNISQLKRIAKKREPVSEELEEAAKINTAAIVLNGMAPDAIVKQLREVAVKCFISGANWQKERDIQDMLKADYTEFIKCYEQGKTDMKEQMMKDVVSDGREHSDWLGLYEGVWQKIVDLGLTELPYKGNGDKVKLIIVKED